MMSFVATGTGESLTAKLRAQVVEEEGFFGAASDMLHPFDQAPEVLSPPTPLKQQLASVLVSPRLIGALGFWLLVTVLCCALEPEGQRLFLSEVSEKGVDNQEHCVELCKSNVLYQSFKSKDFCDPAGQYFRYKKEKNEEKSQAMGTPVYSRTCTFKLGPPRWQPLVVIGVLAVSVVLIIDGAPAEIVLIGACVCLAAVGILDPKTDAYAGLGNSSVVALGLLFPIAAAIDETGALELVLGKMLGTPGGLSSAMFRLMGCVALLSAVLSNTAVVAAMIPAIVAWARRINISPSLMLMPLSFGAQLGGSCTLIGSSHCLVAQEKTRLIYGDQPMGMFDLAPIGAVLTILITGACILFSCLLPQPPPAQPGERADEEAGGAGSTYVICVSVQPEGLLEGKTIEETGIERLPGVKAVSKQDAGKDRLAPSEEVWVNCTAEGLVNLRQIRGLELINSLEVSMLGTHRRRRRLFEATVHGTAPLLQRTITADHIRKIYGACIISLRRPGQPGTFVWREAGSHVVKAGDILIFEADLQYTGSLAWSQSFALVRELPNSSPPRTGAPADFPRAVFVCTGMLVLIILVSLKDIPKFGSVPNPVAGMVGLDVGAGILVLLLLATRAITPETFFTSIKPSVLLTIAGAIGLGQALQKTGVATFIANQVVAVAGKGGRPGMYAAVYFITVGLSMFINNSATIAIVAPMLKTMGNLGNGASIPGKYLSLVLVYAAGSCFTTPLGYQTNMMVLRDGGYEFGHFMKFGGPVQVVHAAACVGLIMLAERYGI